MRLVFFVWQVDLKDLFSPVRPVMSEEEANELEEQWKDDVSDIMCNYMINNTTRVFTVSQHIFK